MLYFIKEVIYKEKKNYQEILYGFQTNLNVVSDISPYLVDQIYINHDTSISKRKLFNWKKCFEDDKFKLEDVDKSLYYTGKMKTKTKLYPHMQLWINHYGWNAKKYFYTPIHNMWVPPNPKTQKWIKINLSEHFLNEKRFNEKDHLIILDQILNGF